MRLRPAPTTTAAIWLLIAAATIPMRDVFGTGSWLVNIVAAALGASLVASAIETSRPRLSGAVICAATAAGAAAWATLVVLRETFWSSPGSADVVRELFDGVLHGWSALLDEQVPLTDPQRAETFASFLVWVVAALAVHVAARGRTALAAVGAGAVLLSISTAAVLPRGLPPAVVGVGAGMAALVAVATLTRAADQQWLAGRVVALAAIVGASASIAALAGLVAPSLDRTPVDPRSAREVEVVNIEVPDVLAEFGTRRQGTEPVLSIESEVPPAGLRLRLQVYDEHNGERWVPSAEFEQIATFPSPTELPPGEPVDLSIRLEDLDGPWIPVPDRLVGIDVEDLRWNEDAQTLISPRPPVDYAVSGTLVGRADLDGIEAARDEVDREVGTPPNGLPDLIRETAAEVTAETTDAISAVDAVTARVQRLGRDESTPPGNSFGRLRDDLEMERATGAEQIASLHALMLRSIGIPSRVVVGYLANGPIVEPTDLQVWVEVAFSGVGWVIIDPVPAETETGDSSAQENVPTTTAPPTDSPLQAQALPRELGPGEDPDEPEIGSNDQLTWGDVAGYALIAVLALVALLVGLRVLRRRLRYGRGRAAEVRVLGAWAELVDRLRELGAPILSTTTTGDVVFMATAMDDTLGAHTAALAGLAAAALHAPHASEPDDAAAAWDELHVAEARIVEIRGRTAVPRRYLDPRVLRYNAPRPPASREGGHRSKVRERSRFS
ncbi:MAG: transglutaminaseTgpA domain-containing protein [Acidimicrobiales bacterium]